MIFLKKEILSYRKEKKTKDNKNHERKTLLFLIKNVEFKISLHTTSRYEYENDIQIRSKKQSI